MLLTYAIIYVQNVNNQHFRSEDVTYGRGKGSTWCIIIYKWWWSQTMNISSALSPPNSFLKLCRRLLATSYRLDLWKNHLKYCCFSSYWLINPIDNLQSSSLHVIKDLIQGVRMSTLKLKQQLTLWARWLSWERRTKHFLEDCCPLSSAAFRKDENFELFNFPLLLISATITFQQNLSDFFIACIVHISMTHYN